MVDLYPDPHFHARSVTVLGSTGSVGTQTLDVIEKLGLPIDLMTAGENVGLFAEQVKKHQPKAVAMASEKAADELKNLLGGFSPEILWKEDEIYDAIEKTPSDIIFHSVSGLAGIGYALSAARSGKRIGMANKEAIIAVGDMIFAEMNRSGGTMIPVDSEHSAVFRCLEGHDPKDVKKIILTASGGPFFGKTKEELVCVTVADTLNHPTWKMGKKITVDSATLMNKGFEIMEAVRLFGVPEDRVDVVIHRQSIIHSLVEYNDNTLLAELGRPDMRDCIRYAATAPHPASFGGEGLDLAKLATLTFDRPDTDAFPLLNAAREAIRVGGTMPASLIAADEVAVDAFLREKIGFSDIAFFVFETMSKTVVSHALSKESVLAAVEETKRVASSLIEKSIS